ncbi:MAG: cyanophycin synthetase [Sphaerochaetaceae bacterium]
MRFSDFNQFCLYMESFTNLERKNSHYTPREYRLDRMEKLLKHLGNPEKSYKTIHLAGSKGKGSTAIFLAQGLTALGYKTGLYSSPHLIDYRERFTLSGTFFSEEELVAVANSLVEMLANFSFSDASGVSEPTTFELYTAYAYLLFKATNCAWAVIETGLGGRLDATNTLLPQGCVITPIELEHTAILGHTLSLIATEKAKIIKENTPVFISRQNYRVREVLLKEAAAKNAHLWDLEAAVESLATKTTNEGEVVKITWITGDETNLLLQMRGEAQAENSALALLVLKELGLYQPTLTEKAIMEAKLPGRMEILGGPPPLVIDGAHTTESLRHLLNSFVQLYGKQDNTLIFGALEGKDHTHMAHLFLPLFTNVIVCRPGTFKQSDIVKLYKLLQEEAKKLKVEVNLFFEPEAGEALSLAYSLTTRTNAILCTGSFYLGGDVTKAYQARQVDESKLA